MTNPSIHEIQKLLFCRGEFPHPLYFNWIGQNQHGTISQPVTGSLFKNDEISGDTYFNSFYADYWRKYTSVNKVGLKIEFQGKIELKAIAINRKGRRSVIFNREMKCLSKKSESGELFWLLDFGSDARDSAEVCRVFVEIKALSSAKIRKLSYVTDTAPKRPVKLSVGICTFNRETELARTLGSLLSEPDARDFIGKIYVVNHSGSFGDRILRTVTRDSLVQVMRQDNLGGCGGFNRTMYEAVSSENEFTHHLLMDDDIILDPRIIFRAVRILQYSRKEMVVGGQMFDGWGSTTIHEAGGRLDPFWYVVSLARHQDMADPTQSEFFNEVVPADYNAWWFCILPLATIRKVGFSPPMFIHGDDIEYGCRLAKAGIETVSMPGIAVWHESFSLKNNDWIHYYDLRNRLIISAVHGDKIALPDGLYVFGYMLHHLLIHRYRSSQMCLAGVKDFLAGPQAIVRTSAADIHRKVTSIGRPEGKEILLSPEEKGKFDVESLEEMPDSKLAVARNFIKSIFSVMFLPSKGRTKRIFRNYMVHPGTLQNDSYLLVNDSDEKRFLHFSPDRVKLLKGVFRAAIAAFSYSLTRKRVARKWSNEIGSIQSERFWKSVFLDRHD